MNKSFITVERQEVAGFIATQMARMAVPSQRVRNDLANIQIDIVAVVENYDEHPSVRLKLDVAEGMGLEILVRLSEFAERPAEYMRDLMGNLHGIRLAALQRRSDRKAEVSQVYRMMGGAQ